MDTIGREGQPGEQIQNVISVGMLSEGWDAKTVTHIMGLRAFTSQLLCEQVVGRGLRRTSYDVNREDRAVSSRSTSTSLAYRSRFFLTRVAPMLRRHLPRQARPELSLSPSDGRSMR